MIGARSLLTVIEQSTPLEAEMPICPLIEENTRRYGLPGDVGQASFTVEHRIGGSSLIELESFPGGRTALSVQDCHATGIIPSPTFDPVALPALQEML